MFNNFSNVIIFILLEIIYIIKSSAIFKSYQLITGDILIINSAGILLQNQLTKNLSTIKSFNNSISIGTVKELQYVTISQFSSEKDGLILCYIKQNLFVISNDYKTICTNKLEISADHVIIIPYDIKLENNNKNYYYIICFLSSDNKNPINIHEYYYNINTCNYTLKIIIQLNQ